MSALAHPFRPAGAEKIDPVLIVLWIALMALAVIWIAPFVFILFTSLKSNATVMGTGAFALPTEADWGNYTRAWFRGKFGTTVLNSAIITLMAAFG